MQNRLLETFLEDKKISNLYCSYLENSTPEKKELIEKHFKIHVKKIQILSYFSKILYFESQRFDNKFQKLSKKNPLILDKDFDDSNTSPLDLIKSERNDNYFENVISIDFRKMENLFEDEALYKIVSNLSLKQKEILYSIYVRGLTEEVVATQLSVTKQAINKTKNNALKKIRQEYKQF